MSHQHHGRPCHLNGCDTEPVPVECPACEQVIGRAPKGGMAQASATWDKRKTHLSDCPTRRGGVTMPIASWYCIHPGERTFAPADGPVLPEPDRCVHEECKPPGPQLVLDATLDIHTEAGRNNRVAIEDVRRLDIKPGEVLVARVPDNTPLDKCMQLKDQLTAALPDVRLLVTTASVDLSVLNPLDLELPTQDHPTAG